VIQQQPQAALAAAQRLELAKAWEEFDAEQANV